MKTAAELLTHWQTVADAVCFDSTAHIDSFNSEIHKEVLAHERTEPSVALVLVNIKYQLNKRYYEAKRGNVGRAV